MSVADVKPNADVGDCHQGSRPMARWEPDAFGRLQRAAVELYGERGYDRTTVAEIAARAGLSERTYFRHFADKREVLFHGSEGLQESLLAAVRQAPADEPPLEAVTRGLRRIGSFLDKRRAPRGGATRSSAPIQSCRNANS
jgi:AcrR family transcriptional regulator